MKQALVLGAGGFLGSHMVDRLKAEGYHVTGVSRRVPPCTTADYFIEQDLCGMLSSDPMFKGVDEVYQFACEVGGLGYIANKNYEVEILRNSTQIDMNVLAAVHHQYSLGRKPKLFFASSGCVYGGNKRFFAESDAYPAQCSNEFAWQKLFAERLYRAYACNLHLDIRIGRLFNTYGPGMAWRGGREKSVAALCRKVAETVNGGTIKVWGSGQQTRSYMHVDDAVEGIWQLMASDVREPVNIGPSSEVTIRDLVQTISRIAGKSVFSEYTDGPTGVSRICSDNTLIRQLLGWEPTIPIEEGLQNAYEWVEKEVLAFGRKP
jgi:GDP-D-mannose 3',5'-epimerase